MNIDNTRRLQLDRESRGTRYYRNAVERHWDPFNIDLETDRERLVAYLRDVDEPETYFSAMRMGIARFGAGEQAVTEDLAPLSTALSDIDDQLFITSQLYEEGKHTEHFDRYWREVVHEVEAELGLEHSSPTDDEWFNDPYHELFRRNEEAMDALLDEPTPEDFAPMEPISIYGASKLGEEALLSVYAHSHDVTVWTFRFANIVGPRLQRGAVIPDFIHKLRRDPTALEILGDGRQEKSYMHIDECIEAMVHVVEHADAPVNTYNLGTRTTTSVRTIADIVADELGVDPEYEFTGGERGWTGDVPRMRLSVEKLAGLGFEPTDSSDEAVRRATRELLDADLG